MLVMNEKEEYVSPIAMYAKRGVASLREAIQQKFAMASFCNLVSVISLGTSYWHDRVPFVGGVFLVSAGLLTSTLYWTLYPPVESVEKMLRRIYEKDDDGEESCTPEQMDDEYTGISV
jgi:hypothetical protein